MKLLLSIGSLLILVACGDSEPPKKPQKIYEADTTAVDSTDADTTKKAEDEDHSQEQMERLVLPVH